MHRSTVSWATRMVAGLFTFILSGSLSLHAQSNVTIRLMAANLNGNVQSIQPNEINIYKGLKPDIVCIQEFNYSNNTAANFRSLLDNAFGTNFVYFRESSSFQIPNGIISRYPILASGSWTDTQMSSPNRGFAWARIDVPGTNDLYVVSVHLLTKDASTRNSEGTALKALIQANFPANAWIVIGGDFNTDTKSEAVISTLAAVAVDKPVPTDAESGGDQDTNNGRNKPYDYLLISPSLTNYFTPVVFPSHTFNNGLVFDSRVYTPLSDVPPVVSSDSSPAQHMAILKDFSIPVSGSNVATAPIINTQPQSQTVAVGSSATFTVAVSGTAPLAYQWRFNGNNLTGANTNFYTIANAQTASNGNYTVVITNSAGSVTSSIATLTVSNIPPSITTNPASLTIFVGETAAFSVSANGTAPLTYQWRFNGTNLAGATNDDYSFNNAQTNNAGNYTVVVTNSSGSVTSAVAVLSVSNATPVILTNPAPLTVTVGASATFTVVADGAQPLEYQWRFNGTDIGGADSASYTIASAQSSNAGNYTVVVTNLAGSITSSVAALTVNASVPTFTGTLAGWDTSTLTGGTGNYGPSPMTATTNAANVTVTGLTRGSGVTTLNSASAKAWGGNGWDSATSAAAITANDFATCAVMANAGYSVSFAVISKLDYRRSGTGPVSGLVQYQIGPGAFTDITTITYSGTAGTSAASITLSNIPALQNVGAGTNVTFRIVNYGASGSSGNWYINDTAGSTAADFAIDGTVSSTSAPTPASAPTLSAPNYGNNQFSFLVSGTATTNYLVQGCTNLVQTNWIPLLTNAAPFTFTQSNAGTFPLKFFRAILP